MFQLNKIRSEQKTGIIVLIPKVKNPKQISEYRPITLLNTDFKIYTRIIAARMKGQLDRWLHASQSGLSVNRCAVNNLHQLYELIHLTRTNKQEVCILYCHSIFDRLLML